MILPIFAYGQPVLKKRAVDFTLPDEELLKLIDDMWETMYHAKGVGLAAPQVGVSKRVFLVDTTQIHGDEGEEEGIKQAFINPEIINYSDDDSKYEEGCLSIPDINADVVRPDRVRIKYFDEAFNEKIETFEGYEARVIQHEYDHLEGVLFVEKLGPLKRKRFAKKLERIKRGEATAKYKLKFV